MKQALLAGLLAAVLSSQFLAAPLADEQATAAQPQSTPIDEEALAHLRELWLGGQIDEAREFVAGWAGRQPDTPTGVVLKAQLLGFEGNTTDALRAAESAVERFPESSHALEVRGRCHLAKRDLDRALRDLRRAVALLPSNRSARSRLGTLLVEMGQDTEAIAVLRSLPLEEGENEPMVALFTALLNQGNLVDAKSLAEDAVRRHPDRGGAFGLVAFVHLAEKDIPAACVAIDKAAALKPNDCQIRSNRAQIYAMAKNWDVAFSEAGEAIRLAPDNVERAQRYWMRALLHHLRSDRKGALDDVTNAVNEDPANAFYLAERSEEYIKIRNYQAAYDDLTKAIVGIQGGSMIRGRVTLANLHRWRSTTALFMGDVDRSRADRAEAERLDAEEANPEEGKPAEAGGPSSVASANGSAVGGSDSTERTAVEAIDALLNRAAYAEARQQAEEALRKLPESNELLRRRGWANFELGNYLPAFADFDQALRLDPRSTSALRGRSSCHQLLGRPTEAYADLTLAIEIEPARSEHWSMRSQVAPNVKASFADLAKAIELDPNDAKPYLDRGCRLCGERQYEVAAIELRRALARWPKNAKKGAISFAYAQLASALAETGTPPAEVEDLFRKALEDSPDHPIVLRLHANYLRRHGRAAEAFAALARIAPENAAQMPDVEVDRAELLRDLGQHAEALQLATKQLDEGPHFRARLLRLRASIYAAQQRWQDYESDLQLAIALEEPKSDTPGLLEEVRKR